MSEWLARIRKKLIFKIYTLEKYLLSTISNHFQYIISHISRFIQEIVVSLLIDYN